MFSVFVIMTDKYRRERITEKGNDKRKNWYWFSFFLPSAKEIQRVG